MASSSSPSSTAANRDGSASAAEDEAVMSVTRVFAQDALLQFQSGKFDKCLTALSECLKRKPNDPKISHNIGLAEFYRDGCSDPKRLLDVLNNVKKRSEELARTSAEQVESGSNTGDKVALGSKGSGAMGHSFSAVYMDEFDTYVAILNIAVIWFHLHEYAKALSVVEPLFQNRGPIDEKTALNICLLLLDVGLACHDAMKSADVLIYLDKAFGVSCMNQGDGGSTALQQPANPVAKPPSLSTNSSATDGPTLDSDPNALEPEETSEFDNADFDMDVAQPTVLLSSNDISRNPVDISASSVYLKLKMQLYKVQFLLLTRNLKQAKREVKNAMNIARGRDSSMALLLKSQLEYARGNYRKAIKLLMASSNRTDTRLSSMINNNLGCIYYQLGKYHTSSVFFSNALLNCSSLRKDRPLNLSTFSQDNSHLIVYNCGMQNLACGKPLLAARCFQKAGLVFYNQPLLWLRFAECCLMALEKGLMKTNLASSEVRVYVIGNGKWRQLVMEDGVSKNGNLGSFERGDLFLGSDRQPKLSVSLARQCLLNALSLLNRSESSYCKNSLPSNFFLEDNELGEVAASKNSNHKNFHSMNSEASVLSVGLGQVGINGDGKEQRAGTTQELVQNSLSYYADVRNKENLLIKQALLANLAYVELELENPMKAFSIARSLLELPECSRIYIFLGHVYAAEALCLLNRLKDAADHLMTYLSGGNDVELPFSEEDCEQLQGVRADDYEESNGGSMAARNSSPEDRLGIAFLKPEEARANLYVNFAALYAMQGELDQARQFVAQALSITPNSPEATLTAVYVDLKAGRSQEALAKLKHCSRITFVPSGLTLNKAS
ncbi:CCR4-NOT transcription complex subunit 10 isoform X1 [Pyrus x bretschneideri]|uniref:CCR4-NOT transcription complex subunit 10 isoform X1 n=1 Tax=Pyrus x bretschneideri TaxID=225117 RepID=UPI0020308543|nr:CCR4-NOT transcription complex subunit 10 isoform X1 [Pyrus x bretschneideri]XP_009340642.2 CCR4-NOT transcription complex subunit 10 isoform X1 [Pyrus x bretschneideri]